MNRSMRWGAAVVALGAWVWLSGGCVSTGISSARVDPGAFQAGKTRVGDQETDDDPQNDVPVSISVSDPSEVGSDGSRIRTTVVLADEADSDGQVVFYRITAPVDVIAGPSSGLFTIAQDREVGSFDLETLDIDVGYDVTILIEVYAQGNEDIKRYTSVLVTDSP